MRGLTPGIGCENNIPSAGASEPGGESHQQPCRAQCGHCNGAAVPHSQCHPGMHFLPPASLDSLTRFPQIVNLPLFHLQLYPDISNFNNLT